MRRARSPSCVARPTEAPGLGVVRMAVLSAARALPAVDRAGIPGRGRPHRRTAKSPSGPPPPPRRRARRAGRRQSARAWLALAGDNRFPSHQRRAAARHASEIAAGSLPREHLAALQLRAASAHGTGAPGVPARGAGAGRRRGDRSRRRGWRLAAAWIEAGGARRASSRCSSWPRKPAAPPEEVMRLRREVDRRRRAPPRAPAAAPPPARSRPGAAAGRCRRRPRQIRVARALAAVRAGRGVLARRLRASRRCAPHPPARPAAARRACAAVDAALRQAGSPNRRCCSAARSWKTRRRARRGRPGL